MLDSEAQFAKSHPLEYASRKGWAQVPPPINFSDPQSIAQGFQANAQITAAVARREPGVSPSAIPETQKPDYIGSQLNEFMAANGHPGACGYLVPDDNTEAEIKSDRAPGYRVVAQGNDGQYHALPTTARFYANPQVAMGRAQEDFTSANRPSWQGALLWSTQ